MNETVGEMNAENFIHEGVDVAFTNQELDDFGDFFFSLQDIVSDHDDDNDEVADGNTEGCINALPITPSKLDRRDLGTPDEVVHANVFDDGSHFNFLHFCEANKENRQKKQQHQNQNVLSHTDSLGSISSLLGSPHSHDLIGSQLKSTFPLLPFSSTSEIGRPSPLSDSGCPEVAVYSSIVDSPLRGRALDFRAFLTKKHVPVSIMKENQVGVFVGQLPSTYSEEDTAALLRAIGADANVPILVQDVKSHNQSRTCAFVVVNSSALPVLLGYSKRILCDVSCVWVVEREQAPHLKDYVNSFLRDRLRGVPKAALVLEELTPQYVRNRTSCSKWSKFNGSPHTSITPRVAPDNLMPVNDEGFSPLQPRTMPMGFFLPGWSPMDPSALPFPGGSSVGNSTPFVNTLPNSNMYGLPHGSVFATPQASLGMNSTPQVSFYMVAAPPNGFPPVFAGHLDNNTSAARVGNGIEVGVFSGNGSSGVSNNGKGNNNNNHKNSARMGFQTNEPGLRSHCGVPPSLPQQYDATSCSMFVAPVGSLETPFVYPNDQTLICINSSNWRLGMGMGMNEIQHATRGMPTCVIPPSNLNGFPPQQQQYQRPQQPQREEWEWEGMEALRQSLCTRYLRTGHNRFHAHS